MSGDVLYLYKDGSITIVERGTGGLAHGTELIRGLVEGKTAVGKDFDVVISNDARGVTINDDEPLNLKTNALTKPVYGPNASNGKGTGSNVYIGLELNSNLLMLDGTREKIPYNIAVGHELIHADNNRGGNRSIKRIEGLPTIKNSEELKSIQRENILRSEQGNKLRYDGSMFIKK